MRALFVFLKQQTEKRDWRPSGDGCAACSADRNAGANSGDDDCDLMVRKKKDSSVP